MSTPTWIYAKSYVEMSRLAAEKIAELVKQKPSCTLGLATGSSPIGIYAHLIKLHKEATLSFSSVQSINLDEYVGLPITHDQSYRYFMNHYLFSSIDIKPENTHVPNGCAEDIEAECRRYSEMISAMGGIDLQLLGVGRNGHIAFNEPSDEFISRTHRVTLTDSTRKANSRFFSSLDEVPTHAVTMGIADIFEAREILLVASGKEKVALLQKALNGNIDPHIPVSILSLHPHVTVIVTEED